MSFPNPDDFKDFRAFSKKLIEEMERRQADPTGELEGPQPVKLTHYLEDADSNLGLERATVEGVLMWDPVTKTIRISVSGAWYYLVPVSSYP